MNSNSSNYPTHQQIFVWDQDWRAEGSDGWHLTQAVRLWPYIRGKLWLWQVWTVDIMLFLYNWCKCQKDPKLWPTEHAVNKAKTKTIVTYFKCFFSLSISAFSDFNVHAGPVDTAFIVDHLSYKSPFADELLVEDLSLKIGQGAHVLVVGNTGTGKTSLLRVLNRLWEAHNGECATTGSA